MNIKDIAEILEILPRSIQIMNSVKLLTEEQVEKCKYPELVKFLRENYVESCLTDDVVNTQVEVISFLDKGAFQFTTNSSCIPLFQPIHLYIPYYYRLRDNHPLLPFKSQQEYTPSSLEAKVIDFSISSKQGIARLLSLPLILKDSSNLLYEYSTEDVGHSITPFIKDAYLIR